MRKQDLMILVAAILLISPLMPLPRSLGDKANKPDSYGYFWVDSNQPPPTVTYQWLDVKSQGSMINFNQISSPATVSLPFSIPFYGRSYNRIYISAYGYLSFISYTSAYAISIPYTSLPNAVVAVYSSYDAAYRGGGVYYLIGTEGDRRFVAVEWQTDYDQNFEVIIYETGFIKMQYRDVDATYSPYSNGARSYCGIEDHSGTVGTVYCANNGNIRNGLAVVYTLYRTRISYVELMDGDGSSGNFVLAKYKTYHLDVTVSDDGGFSDISEVKVKLGNFTGSPTITYENKNRTFSLSDPRGYLSLVESECDVTTIGEFEAVLTFAFVVNFTYPQNGYINLTIEANALMALESKAYHLTTLFIISRVIVTGVPTFTGSLQGRISDGDFIRGGEEVTISGLALYYNMTIYSPPNEVFSVYLSDTLGGRWWDNSSSGRKVHITARAPEEDLIWHLVFGVVGIPESSLIMAPIEISLKVDNTPPPSPYNVKVHADSYNDTATEYDDDRDIFITWEADEEEGSGISHFILVVERGTDHINITLPGAELRKYRLSGAPQGRLRIGVKAVDRVGNVGEAEYTQFTVDLTPVEFRLLDPPEKTWITTDSPLIKVEISDPDTEVDGPTVEYALSTDGGITWSDWRNAGAYEKASKIVVELPLTLSEGRKNLIMFRAKDVAGNPYNESPAYSIWVDTTAPQFFDFYPGEEWVTTETVRVRIKVTDAPGVGIDLSKVMYRYSRMGPGSYTSWMPIQGTMDSYGVLTLSTTLQLSPTGQNLIQFKVSDVLGHVGVSPEFIINVDNPPEVSLVSPLPGERYLSNETVPLKCTIKDRDGNPDKLWVTWIVDDVIVGTSQNLTLKGLAPGVHTIVLKVHDSIPLPSHNITRWVRIVIEEPPPSDPFLRDSDSDGIPDGYEEQWGTDPFKADSSMDTDGDGYTNLEEYLAGTDPTKRSSSPSKGLIETSPSAILIAAIAVVIAGLVFLNYYMKRRWKEKLLTLQSVAQAQPAPSQPPPMELPAGMPGVAEGVAPLPPGEQEEYQLKTPVETIYEEALEEGPGGAAVERGEEVQQVAPMPLQTPEAPEVEGAGAPAVAGDEVVGEEVGAEEAKEEMEIPPPPPPPPPPPEDEP